MNQFPLIERFLAGEPKWEEILTCSELKRYFMMISNKFLKNSTDQVDRPMLLESSYFTVSCPVLIKF
jgi:hypothetical protein